MEHQQSMQEQYLEVIKKIIEDNIDNESFSVADLARETGQSGFRDQPPEPLPPFTDPMVEAYPDQYSSCLSGASTSKPLNS